ncbi:DUF4145 domain-containing protein [Arthrobacter psychrolactophilus]|uniref:DUF4145 domain-containing protein n=1 Tax=Arthrobacter psychrolactophilus TaxID=92442 RepID=UPI0015E8C611|nr:DUF4145 domain-containing protein [Arthrobacter psychrolactophilus]
MQAAFSCAACKLLSLGSTDIFAGSSEWAYELVAGEEVKYWSAIGVESWLPDNGGPKIANLPATVQKASEEAFKSFKAGQHMAAILMARTTIEATAKAHGIDKGTLASKIKKMHDQHLILVSTKTAADAIRDFGNDMAHGDLDVAVAWSDARDCVQLMELILREVFELPHLASQLEARAAKRKAQSVPAEQ